MRGLNRDLLQLRRRAGGDGSPPPAGAAPPIRETVFGRDAGRERGDDYVIRACDAIERESGKRRGGKSRAGRPGRGRAGRESGRAERELDRGPGAADGSGREHEKAAGPKPKTPDVDLGMQLPLPASGQTTPATPRDNCRNPRCAARRSRALWRPLTRLRRREPGGGGIGQATYAAQSFIRIRRRSNRSLRR